MSYSYLPKQLLKISWSQLKKWKKCPEAWRLEYITGLKPDRWTPQMRKGQLLHEMFELFFTKNRRYFDVFQKISDELDDDQNEALILAKTALKLLQDRGFEIFENERPFNILVQVFPNFRVEKVDVPENDELEKEYSTPPFVLIRGRFDFLVLDPIERVGVFDLKTGWTRHPDITQLYLYAWAAKQIWKDIDMVPEFAGFVMPALVELQQFNLDWTEVDAYIDAFVEDVRQMIEMIKANRFPMNSGMNCLTCPFAAGCAFGKDLDSLKEQIDLLIDTKLQMEKALKDINERLREYAKDGYLETDKYVIELKPQVSYRLPKDKRTEFMKHLLNELDGKYLTPKVKDAIEKHPELAEKFGIKPTLTKKLNLTVKEKQEEADKDD